MIRENDMNRFEYFAWFWLFLAMPDTTVTVFAADSVTPPFRCVRGHAYHILPETHNMESGYFSLCEAHNDRIYVGTAKYGENCYLVEFDPETGKQRVVVDTNKICGLKPEGWYAAQAKIHTRNFVAPSGKIYLGTMGGYRKDGDDSEYPGGYVMVYDPKTETGENLGIPYPGEGIMDIVADEQRGLIYVITDDLGAENNEHWVRYDASTKQYSVFGPLLVTFGTTLVDSKGRANAITGDGRLAQYDPDSGKLTVRRLTVDGQEVAGPLRVPTWNLAADGRTAYLIQLTDPTLYAIDLLSEGEHVSAVSHGRMIEGRGYDSRCALSIGPDGSVYAVVRVDNDTGFGRPDDYVHHLVRFDPQTKKMTDAGVLTVENPDFFYHSPGARQSGMITGSQTNPSYYGFHKFSDGTMAVKLNHMAMIVARDGTIYVTVLFPFTLLKIEPDAYRQAAK